MTADAIATLPGRDVTVYTVSGARWPGRVDHVVATAAGDPSAIAVTLDNSDNGDGSVIIPWHAVTEITVTP